MADPAASGASLEERTRSAIEGFRPYIQADGGDIELVKVENGIAHVRLRGACTGCPHAALTLRMGVERYLLQRVPELRGVAEASQQESAPSG